ncbi:uncharacterized protein LAJ45_01865 [Morchella importuna]|uniref:uncharacterized protein n=1 Tax=Morchella importuna TaxID=1174673 RepID=UPI001E8CB946|nr:uncharacterized protein LAJ45_01865 [Morchella importuna]KAH8154098.1 hypothetical protein LAJ45_01865 [Morchella importuna]
MLRARARQLAVELVKPLIAQFHIGTKTSIVKYYLLFVSKLSLLAKCCLIILQLSTNTCKKHASKHTYFPVSDTAAFTRDAYAKFSGEPFMQVASSYTS